MRIKFFAAIFLPRPFPFLRRKRRFKISSPRIIILAGAEAWPRPSLQMRSLQKAKNLATKLISWRNAFAIRGLPLPPISIPAPPKLLPITDAGAISWQGSIGAGSYQVERAAKRRSAESKFHSLPCPNEQASRIGNFLRGFGCAAISVYEGHTGKIMDHGKECWPQAEALVGFLNVFQISGDGKFLVAARHYWNYISCNLVQRVHVKWFGTLHSARVHLLKRSCN